MKHRVALVEIALAVACFIIAATDLSAKDINPLANQLYKLYRDQYNPDLSLPDSVVEDLLAVGTFRLKEKPKTALSLESVRDWMFADKAKR